MNQINSVVNRVASPQSTDVEAGVPERSGVFWGGLAAVGIVLVWLLIIYNRFLTPHEGWFSYYGLLMKSGKVPYRDFYFFTQPFHLLVAWVVSSFGDKLIYFRIYGVLDRVVLTSLLYYLLSRQFSATAALCGTVASSFFFLAYPTDALMSYLYTCLLFLLASLACLHKAWSTPAHRSAWMFAAGVMAALCFFTKQSNGLLAIAGLGFIIAVMAPTLRRALADWVPYAGGLVAGSVPFLLWLFLSGAWQAYVNEVFLGAASSKGGLKAVLFGFVSRQIDKKSILAFVLLVFGTVALMLLRKLYILPASRRAVSLSPFAATGLVVGTSLLGIVLVRTVPNFPRHLMDFSTRISVNVLLYALLPVLAIVLWRRFVSLGFRSTAGYEVPIALLITSVYWTYGCGMSWNVAEQSVIPSLALLLAFCYDRLQLGRTSYASVLILLVAVGFTQLGIWHKWNRAFNWEGWGEAMSSDRARSHWPQLADFEIARDEVVIYDTILDDIAKYTKPGEPIVTFATIPMFNFIGQHWQPGFAPVHYWDVCPDEVARKDAELVAKMRPKMIVELELADWVWKEHDEGWRAGRKSGQRDFQNAIDALTSSGDYRKLHTLKTPELDMDLVVWLKERN